MKGIAVVAAVGSLLATTIQARDGVVRFDIKRRQHNVPPRLARRSESTLPVSLANNVENGAYFVDVSMGTPPQRLSLQLDTGSSDTWAPLTSASICQRSAGNPQGCSFGAFNPNTSSTFKDIGPNQFSITYGDNTMSTGDYFSDVLEIGGTELKNFTMGLGANTTNSWGLVGVGYASGEAITQSGQNLAAEYPNLPAFLMEKNMINTVAYSLWLNDLQASTGNILFGAIDTEQYHGDLVRVNVLKDPRIGIIDQFTVALTSIQAVSSTGNDSLSSLEFPIAVDLDSGTTLSLLPTDLAEEVWREAGASYDTDAQSALIPCSRSNSSGYFAFGFGGEGGPVINVHMSELVLPLVVNTTAEQTTCRFGIQNMTASPDALYLFGDTILRSAYVVYDLVNNEVGIAQTNLNATSTNVVAFASSGAPIPSSTPAPSQAQIANNASSTTPPSFSAELGFGNGTTGSGNGNAGSTPSVLDYPQLVFIGVSVFFAMAGSGFFML